MRHIVEVDTKAYHRLGPNRGTRMLILAALIAVTYLLGTSLFSSVRSTEVVGWVFNAIHHGSSQDRIMVFNYWLRWSAHYLQFFALFLLLAVWPLRIRPAAALALCVLLAAADEGHQYFIPDRTCSLLDLEVDSAGTVSALIVVLAARRLRGRSRTASAIVSGLGEEASA